MLKYLAPVIIALFYCSSVNSQNSISIEHVVNSSQKEFFLSPDFYTKIGANGIAYQLNVVNNFYVKGFVGIRKISTYTINPSPDGGSTSQFLYNLDLRYDILPLLIDSKSRIKFMPLISYGGSYQNRKGFQFPNKSSFHKFSIGTGLDIRLFDHLGMTATYYYGFMDDRMYLTKHQFQIGVNYIFN